MFLKKQMFWKERLTYRRRGERVEKTVLAQRAQKGNWSYM